MAATNPGTTNLISWWKLDEASGNAVDSHGTNHLTETGGTIASVAGKVGNARDFEAGDTEYFDIADNESLSFADENFCFGGWIQFESNPASQMFIISKYDYSGGKREYGLNYENTTDKIRFRISSDGSSVNSVLVDSQNTVGTGTWYFVICWHDKDANTVNMQVDNGAVQSSAWTSGCNNNISPFRLGASGSTDLYFDGLLDEVFIYRRLLTADEREWLYNSGNGRTYAELAVVGGSPIFFD